MPEEEVRTGWKETLLGFVIIVVAGICVTALAVLVYSKFFKPTPLTVSVSAFFIDDTGNAINDPQADSYKTSHLKIQGSVYQGEKPVPTGTTAITVATTDDFFRQTVSVPLKDGKFESDDPAFRAVRPGTALEIRADVTANAGTQRGVIRMNSRSPVDKTDVEYGLAIAVLVLAIVFFLAFTGKKKAWRNQTAIIFSYIVIALFLAVPLLAPVLLIHTFPAAMYAMIGAPAGLINTHTSNQEKCETQWALNIGGYSYIPTPPCSDKNSGTTVDTSSGGKSGNSGSTQGQLPVQVSGQTPGGGSNPESTTSAPTSSTTATGSNSPVKPPIVEVQGGLVIPLYVIILSVIGGAINMTRKVPGFQKEGEESDFSIGRPISSLGLRVMRLARFTPPQAEAVAPEGVPSKDAAAGENATEDAKAGTLEEQAQEVEKDLEPLVVSQIARNCDSDRTLRDIRVLAGKMQELYRIRTTDDPLLKFNSFEDWVAGHPRLAELLRGTWRVELLNQYMYLISAPFLAVVTYYILDLLGLSKQGVVVVLSFSVGLISEKIVSWILGIATGYMRSDAKKATP